jgi:RPA family protein
MIHGQIQIKFLQILVEHVDEESIKQWEMKAVYQGVTELEARIKFLEAKCHALELIHASQHPRNKNSSGISKQTKHAYVATQFMLCVDETIPCIDVSSSRKQAHSRGQI